jgi:hypothetical protein
LCFELYNKYALAKKAMKAPFLMLTRLTGLSGCIVTLLFIAAAAASEETPDGSSAKTCSKPHDQPSIESVDSGGSAPLLMQTKNIDGQYAASAHLRIRNAGTIVINHLCFWSDFNDLKGTIHASSPVLSGASTIDNRTCQNLSIAPGLVATVDLSWPIDSWPWMGAIIISARGMSYESPDAMGATSNSQPVSVSDNQKKDQVQQKKKDQARQKKNDQVQQKPCEANSKEITREVVIPSPAPSRNATTIVCSATGLALLMLLIGVVKFKGNLQDAMGSPTWNFGSSWATNVVAAGGVLMPILNASLMPNYPHYLTKAEYNVLAMLFGAMIVLAPVVYVFLSKPSPAGDGQSQGTVGLFLLSATITVIAVLGQLLTLWFVLKEFALQRYLSSWALGFFSALLLVGGVGILVYTLRTAHAAIVFASATAVQVQPEAVEPRQPAVAAPVKLRQWAVP